MDFNVLKDRNSAAANYSVADYNPSKEYINALSNIKVKPIIPSGDILWSELSKNSGSIFNVLPPALPERSTFVRRPRSLTEQSDLSEISVDEVDRSHGTLRGDAAPPPIISPSKSKEKVEEQEDFDSLLSEFNDNDKNSNKTVDEDVTENKNDESASNKNTAAENSALEFLGMTGGGESSSNKKKKKKKKKGKKNDNNSGGGGNNNNTNGNKSSNKKKAPTASQIAAIEAAARKSKKTKKKKK